MAVRIDSAILHEIARVVQTRSKVPDRVRILKRQYQITYLDDHRQRMEDALRRHDVQLLNMLFGQLASKVKYQALRGTSARASKARPSKTRAAKARPTKARSSTSKARPSTAARRSGGAAPKRSAVSKAAAAKHKPKKKRAARR